jgi:hypothetical protein
MGASAIAEREYLVLRPGPVHRRTHLGGGVRRVRQFAVDGFISILKKRFF